MKTIRFVVAVIATYFGAMSVAMAALVLPSVTGPGWTTDRYEPASWTNVGPFAGRTDVLGIGINDTTNSVNRGGLSASFYNTQGRQIDAVGGTGDSLGASLYIPASWRDGKDGYVRTDLWGRAGGTEADTTYPIIGFTNYDGSARLRVWDADAGGWQNLAIAPSFDDWMDLEIISTATGYEYRVDGALAYTDNTLGLAGGGFTKGFLQAYNFNDPALSISANPAYTAHWSDIVVVPAPGSLALALGALAIIGASRRRRTLSS